MYCYYNWNGFSLVVDYFNPGVAHFKWVLGALFKLKPAKLWQSLLLLATIGAFCVPCWMSHKDCHKGMHCESGEGGGSGKGDCPLPNRVLNRALLLQRRIILTLSVQNLTSAASSLVS